MDLIGSLKVLLLDESYFPSGLSSTYGIFPNKEGEQQKPSVVFVTFLVYFAKKVPFEPCTFSDKILLRKHERKAYKTKNRNKRQSKWRLKPKHHTKTKQMQRLDREQERRRMQCKGN